MTPRLKNLLISLLISTLMILIISVAYYFCVGYPVDGASVAGTKKGVLFYTLTLLGGQMPKGLIQYLTFIFFWFGMLEVMYYNREVKRQYRGFDLRLLPEKEQYVLSPQDINELKLAAIAQEVEEPFFITDIIKKACTKYRSNKSVSEVMEVVSAQVRISLSQSESSQAMIRYVSSGLLSIGFIGTIIGIAIAMEKSGKVAESSENLAMVTESLMLAFNCTLVSLVLNLILNYFYHGLQEKEETFHSDAENYLIENLVNRIHPE